MAAMLRRLLRVTIAALALLPALALATDPVLLCPGQVVEPQPDGRMLGHVPYVEAATADLVAAPAGFPAGLPCLVHRDMLPDLARLLAAAAIAPGVGARLHGVSCFRSIAHQRSVFCSQIGPHRKCRTAAERARSVGPPAFSEHATGYAIDFGLRPALGCADVDPCLAATVPGQWLIAHARDYGFEQSFPAGNAQGVTWEPWHWRWVGTAPGTPGAARARLIFARARSSYPASPAVPDPAAYEPGPAASSPPYILLPQQR